MGGLEPVDRDPVFSPVNEDLECLVGSLHDLVGAPVRPRKWGAVTVLPDEDVLTGVEGRRCKVRRPVLVCLVARRE